MDNILFFYRLVRSYKVDLAKTMVAVITTTLAILLTGYGLRQLVDLGFSDENIRLLNYSVLALIGLATVLSLSAYMRTSTTALLSEKVTNDLRKSLFHHVIMTKQSVLEMQNTGNILSILSADIEHIRQFISGSAATAIRTGLQIIGASSLLVIQSPKLAIYLFIGLPLIFLPLLLFGKKVKVLSTKVQEEEGGALAFAKERLVDLMTIKAFQNEVKTSTTFSHLLDEKLVTATKRTKVRSLVISLVIFLVFSGIASILWLGAYEVIYDRLSPGQLSAFVFYAIIVAGSINNFADVFTSYTQALGAKTRIESLYNLENEALELDYGSDTANSVQKPISFTSLAFQNVTFSYPQRPDVTVFDNLSLRLAKPESIALVGASGAGKSTIFKLLLGFYEMNKGDFLINDQKIPFADIPNYRSLFSLVPQDPIIFHDTIFNNIRMGNETASLDDVKKVMKMAHVDHFVDRFPHGLDTIVGDRGVRLSGGQRQRIALARALLRDSPILLLDEATNALDSESEFHIQQAMKTVLQQKSAIIIAHRLSTIKEVDCIYMLDNNSIGAKGTHDELMKTSKEYAKLAQQQFANDSEKAKQDIQAV